MTLEKIQLRVLILYCWKRRVSTRDAAKKICDTEGEGTAHYTTVSRWYKRFDSGDLNLEDQPRSGRPSTLGNADLQAALEDEPSSSSRELASILGASSHQTVLNLLHQMDFVHKKPRQDPYELTEAQAKHHVEVCRQLLENPLDDRFSKPIVTSDEKWVYLVNHNRQKRWVPRGQNPPSVPRQNRFGKKVMICVWWNFEAVLHLELVPDGCVVNAELYCQ
ncbi:unnamed protein product [Rotaria socialis]|uniref:Mos1 transposase HTH domain-containing protein n=1 Tax=Rotaria socialis TaxID=392032 RepID=A0A821SU61_9BILA|nr:unnamed protein product [Rotaria socialis]CAF4861651.1 unnamed protein product [Rotaria socialis]